MSETTVGIDIGTSSVKAIAADGDGNVVGRARVPHAFRIPTPDRFEHDAAEAWFHGPRAALDALGDVGAVGVSVAAMVPSVAAVGDDGVPVTPGLLYGDERGHTANMGNPTESGEFVAFLRWTVSEAPGARGYWPAQAVANFALAGEPVLDTSTAATTLPLFDWTGWDEALARDVGVRVDQLPKLVPTGLECGRIGGADGPALASGCIDALAEQIVAGADDVGDVLIILGTTLIVWVVVPEDSTPEVPGYFTVPHTTAGKYLFGGPSNSGGLFLNWALGMLGETGDGRVPHDPASVPLWVPYPRGERVPFHDPTRRASLSGLDLTHDPAAARRAAFEAAGFAARRIIEASGAGARRIVATGGGIRVDDWVQALADCTGLPVECAAVPEGGALGSAFLARVAAGLESPMAIPDARRWARTGSRVEPLGPWVEAAGSRYERWLVEAG